MEQLSVDEAHSLLMGEDIRPMTVSEDEWDESRARAAKGAHKHAGGFDVENDSAADEVSLGREEDVSPEAVETAEGSGAHEHAFEQGTVGLGVDIVEIDRMRNILSRRPAFAEQVFSLPEQLYCNRQASPETHYALRFAAKEAVVKALGTGFSDGIWVHDIEVDRDKKGKPFVKLSGRALEVAEEQGVREMSISLSYTRNDAVACAMAITDSAIRATEKRKDPMEELTKQFKETRKMLDEF